MVRGASTGAGTTPLRSPAGSTNQASRHPGRERAGPAVALGVGPQADHPVGGQLSAEVGASRSGTGTGAACGSWRHRPHPEPIDEDGFSGW